MKLKPLRREYHKYLLTELSQMGNRLVTIHCEVSNALGKNSRFQRQSDKAIEVVRALMYSLEDEYCRAYPEDEDPYSRRTGTATRNKPLASKTQTE